MNGKKAKFIRKTIFKHAAKEDLVPNYVQLETGQVVNKNLHKSVYRETKKLVQHMSRKQIKEYLTKKG